MNKLKYIQILKCCYYKMSYLFLEPQHFLYFFFDPQAHRSLGFCFFVLDLFSKTNCSNKLKLFLPNKIYLNIFLHTLYYTFFIISTFFSFNVQKFIFLQAFILCFRFTFGALNWSNVWKKIWRNLFYSTC